MKAPSVLLDTTVFCGALVRPDGLNMRLLKLGTTPLFIPIIAQSVIAEFIHKACSDGIGKGSGKRIYSHEDISVFLDAFSLIIDPKNAVRIRQTYKYVTTFPGDTPLWVVLSKFADFWPIGENLSKKLTKPIQETDLGDFHLILAAIESNPDVVVSSNKGDLKLIEDYCPVLTPSEFLSRIGAL